MLNKSSIEANLYAIEETLIKFKGLDIIANIDYLGEVVALQALATETQASAKYWLLEAIDQELDRQAKLMGADKVAPSIKKLRADSKCREFHYLYEKAQRYASNISHTIGAVRTKISYHKQEMENSKFA
jgi:hypothetical protein